MEGDYYIDLFDTSKISGPCEILQTVLEVNYASCHPINAENLTSVRLSESPREQLGINLATAVNFTAKDKGRYRNP